jgi:hypothetical protein
MSRCKRGFPSDHRSEAMLSRLSDISSWVWVTTVKSWFNLTFTKTPRVTFAES